jgi:TolB-like protein
MSFFSELKRRNVVRVGIAYAIGTWVVLQAVDLLLDLIGAPTWTLQLFAIAAVIGFPITLVFSWVFEMTPDGIKLESQIDHNHPPMAHTGRKLDRVIIVALVIAVALLLVDRFIGDTFLFPLLKNDTAAPAATLGNERVQPEPPLVQVSETIASDEPQSIAVMPFVNMSGDPEQEFFSDGIAEEILNVLTRIPDLKVAARTSSFKFKGAQVDASEIGQQLQVNHLLEGSVRKSGNTLRITAQLIDTKSGFHLWSRTFDRQLEDVFAIQDEIAAAIANELQASLLINRQPASFDVDLKAYELYLKGRSLVAQRTEPGLLEAIDLLTAALVIDPDYAPAMASLATAYVVLPWFSYQIPTGEARGLARDWAGKALLVAPDNSAALAVMGVVKYAVDLDWAESKALFEQALAINPGSVTANNFYGDLMLRTADFSGAFVYESKAFELDLLSPVQAADLSNVLFFTGDYERAVSLAQRALKQDPLSVNSWTNLFDINYIRGNMEVLQQLELDAKRAGGQVAFDISNRMMRVKVQNDPGLARGFLDQRLEDIATGRDGLPFVARDAAFIGDFDLAGELLLKAYKNKEGLWLFPFEIRMPEQAPESALWQQFWSLPGVVELAAIRRANGLDPHIPKFGSGRQNAE